MEDKLKYIFENVNNWLNFAEAKNAALIALNSAAIIGVVSIDDLKLNNVIVVILLVLLGSSTFLSLRSFIPFTGNKLERKIEYWNNKNNTTKNIYLYSFIAKYNMNQQGCNDFLSDLESDCGLEIKSGKEKDCQYLAEEIIYNSKITYRKYKLFGIAIQPLLWAVVILVASIFINFVLNLEFVKNIIESILK